MTVAEDFVSLLHTDCTRTASTELSLPYGLGCIEFVRIVLGIVLAGKEESDHSPDVDIGERDVSVDVPVFMLRRHPARWHGFHICRPAELQWTCFETGNFLFYF